MTAHYSLTKQLRLLNSKDYKHVFDDVLFRVSSKSFLILSRPSQVPDSAHCRLGLIVAKKHVRLAVHRNRAKRIIRESFRHHHHDINGLDVIVLVRSNLSEIDNKELHKQLQKMWRKLINKQQLSNEPNHG